MRCLGITTLWSLIQGNGRQMGCHREARLSLLARTKPTRTRWADGTVLTHTHTRTCSYTLPHIHTHDTLRHTHKHIHALTRPHTHERTHTHTHEDTRAGALCIAMWSKLLAFSDDGCVSACRSALPSPAFCTQNSLSKRLCLAAWQGW